MPIQPGRATQEAMARLGLKGSQRLGLWLPLGRSTQSLCWALRMWGHRDTGDMGRVARSEPSQDGGQKGMAPMGQRLI